MKGILFALILSISAIASARVFYVQDPAYNANASDNNPGTDIDRPWATWQRAFDTAMPGDTVYFRGGTWYPRSDLYGNVTIYHPESGYGFHGTRARPVHFFAYPPDVEAGNMPILDCRHTHPSTNNHVGLFISTTGYAQFKGLEIRNVRSWPQESGEMWCAGIMADGFKHLTLEHMTTSYIGGVGMFLMRADTLFLLNCDSHHNCDSLDVSLPGNDGDGYTMDDDSPVGDSYRMTYISGCRAWNNADDGFNITTRKKLVMRDCWAWNNGDFDGDANGSKMSLSHIKNTWTRLVYNCITAYNEQAGHIDLNLDETIGPYMEYLNNTSYKDGQGFASGKGQVFDCSSHPASVIYRNNISFAPTGPYPAAFKACDFGFPSYVIQDHNTWVQTGSYFHTEANPAYTMTAGDFISLDTAQLRWPRKADGSLPDISFMKLQSNSDLIDGGIDAGLAYHGPAPDLGAFETGSFSVELVAPLIFQEYYKGNQVVMQAKVEGLAESIEEVIFYAEDTERMLGSGVQIAPSLWQFTWESDEIGYQELRAIAMDAQNQTATSSIVRVFIHWPLDTDDTLEGKEELGKIIPNPNDGLFSLELREPLKENSDIHIFSMSGQLVAVERMAKDEITKEVDVSTLPPGFYNVSLASEGQALSRHQSMKMVIN